MPTTATPLSTAAAAEGGTVLPIALARGCSTLLCVPAGATLRTRSGCLLIEEGPLVCGQVLVGAGAACMLRAGSGWSAAEGDGAHWLRVTALESTQAQLEEPAPAPGWLARAGDWMAALAATLRRALPRLAPVPAPEGDARPS